jgi:hypothetical protein
MKAQYMSRLLTQLTINGDRNAIPEHMADAERAQGYTVLRPGEVDWFTHNDWRPSSLLSISGNRVRIVLVEAKRQNGGAFRRLIDDIEALEMVPVVVEPHDRLALKLVSWGWKSRTHGQGDYRETVWYPRRGIL